jgi:MFS family permease
MVDYRYGIRRNFVQFSHQLVQVFFVGLAIGMFRTVVPALAETEFGVASGSFMMLTAFITAFGFVKGALNFVAGRLSERIGRKNVLFLGWLAAVPIPFMIFYAPSWSWIVAATVLLGVNQGLAWSMTQTSQLDMTTADRRGLTIGLNEFSGYFGVAVAGIVTGYLATAHGPREGLLAFALVVVGTAGLLALRWVKDTLPWAHAEGRTQAAGQMTGPKPRYPANISDRPGTWEVFAVMSWRDQRMAAISQAGLVEKFVDALVWAFFPVYLYEHGSSLTSIGWVVGLYGFVWGMSQVLTGRLSDRIGRKRPIVVGMWLCGAGVALVLLGDGESWWSLAAAVMGLGMALLYPTLSAAVSDIAHPNWRGSAIGIYRFWRDLGYGIGALLLGAVAALFGGIEAGFWFTAAAMFVSGTIVLLACEETHPRFNPRPAIETVPFDVSR